MAFKITRWAAGMLAALVAASSAVAGSQEVRITREVMTTNPLGGPGPGGGLEPIPQGTGLILGQAVDAGTNRPVPGALVTLGLPNARPIRALADGQGRFVFRDLPKGRFNLSVTKPGYVEGAYGRMRPSGPTLAFELGDGERASGVALALWRFAAITGVVRDEHGEPAVGAVVRVLRRQIVGGQWKFMPGSQDSTDDRGIYRIGTLEPGDYVVALPMGQSANLAIDGLIGAELDRVVSVAATSVRVVGAGGGAESAIFLEGPEGADAGLDENGRPLTYPTIFYPTANSAARATIVRLGSGEERAGVDFQRKPVRAHTLAGAVLGPNGPVPNLALTLVPAEAETLASAFDTKTAFTTGAGTFAFAAVPPGQYMLRATRTPRVAFSGPGDVVMVQQGGAVIANRMVTMAGSPPLPTEPTLWAELPIAVGADIADLTVALRPGIRVTGMVEFDGAVAKPEPDRLPNIGVSLEPADVRPGVGSARGRIEPSGQFATMGVPPGRYFVRVSGAPQGWVFRGATLGGRDVTDTPLDIESGDVNGVVLVFADRPTELSGQVSMDGGSPEGATVLVFPTDQSAWVGYGSTSRRLRSVRADRTGAYSIGNLPAGEYYVVAVADKMAVDWQSPDFLAALTNQAVRVRLSDGQKATQSLRVAR